MWLWNPAIKTMVYGQWSKHECSTNSIVNVFITITTGLCMTYTGPQSNKKGNKGSSLTQGTVAQTGFWIWVASLSVDKPQVCNGHQYFLIFSSEVMVGGTIKSCAHRPERVLFLLHRTQIDRLVIKSRIEKRQMKSYVMTSYIFTHLICCYCTIVYRSFQNLLRNQKRLNC